MATAPMPVGNTMSLPIRESQVETTEGGESPAVYTEDAAGARVWNNYQRAKQYLENNNYLLDWQEVDILYQSPIPNRLYRIEQGRPARVSRFLVARFTRTLARAVKRALFADQYCFMLRPIGKTTQELADAWTALLGVLLKRMGFVYHGGLQINCQTLQGTGIGKFGWEERTVKKHTRRRKNAEATVQMPEGAQAIPTTKSDDFKPHVETVTESWPFYEYRRLGTTLFDGKWATPDMPEESAEYCIDVDYVSFEDLQRMAQLSCYKIPSEETLKEYFFQKQQGNAPIGSQVEDSMTAQGSAVTHAEGRNVQTDISPLAVPLMLLEQWTKDTVTTILCYDGRTLTIRNEEHNQGSMSHTACTWWPVDSSGYGMGIGKINGSDQRINQGVINESLKMLAYPFNAPILVRRGENAPTQNTIQRMGGYQQVDTGPDGDVRKAMSFMPMPEVPDSAWRMLDISQRGGAELSGADPQMQQGVPSSTQGATRSATGANRLAAMSDQNVADPVDSFCNGVIIPVIEFLIHMVKTKMPIQEIRQILSEKHSALIADAIKFDQLIAAELEVSVLAGNKLLAKQGIAQLIPFFLQIVQQPQLLDFLHQKGDTVDFGVIMDLMLQVSELQNQPGVFRKLTPDEMKMLKMMNPGMQKAQAEQVREKTRGDQEVRAIQAKGEVDLGNKAAELAMERIGDGVPLTRAFGVTERADDQNILKEGLTDATQ